jgi:hypothetical protein
MKVKREGFNTVIIFHLLSHLCDKGKEIFLFSDIFSQFCKE